MSCEPQTQMQSVLVGSGRKNIYSAQRRDTKTDAKRKGFVGPSFTLIVGPDETYLTVPYGFLERIPYFQACIKGNFLENQTHEFRLTGFDPEVIADVIHFANNSQDDIPFPETDPRVAAEAMSLVKHHIRMYIVADMMGIEAIANNIVDGFATYHGDWLIHPELLVFLRQSGLERSQLYSSFLFEFACDHLADCHENWDDVMVEHGGLNLLEAFECLEKDDWVRVMLSITEIRGKRDEDKQQWPSSCRWHVPNRTEKCSKQDTSVDGAES